jgi:hypothetical protein
MGYERPLVTKTYAIDELRADAAACTGYIITVGISDRAFKQQIELVERPLEQLGRI